MNLKYKLDFIKLVVCLCDISCVNYIVTSILLRAVQFNMCVVISTHSSHVIREMEHKHNRAKLMWVDKESLFHRLFATSKHTDVEWHSIKTNKFRINLVKLINPQKIFDQKNFFYQKIIGPKKKLYKKTKKHQLCWNIDLIETSTAPASDIPWGPLNIDRAA